MVVGVDVGSSSARAVAIDRNGQVHGSAKVAYAGADKWTTGHADPRAWRAAVDAAVFEVLAGIPVPPAALAVGGQSVCVVRSDGTDALTVMHPSANDSDTKRAHLAMWAILERPGLLPFQCWDWILHSMGAPHRQGHWQAERELDGFGPVVPTGTVVGAAGPGAPVPEGTPLVPGAVDAYMAFWAAGIDRPGLALDPGGRTGGIGVAVPSRPDEPSGYSLRSAASDVDIVGGAVSAHGLALEWWSAMTGRTVEESLAGAATAPAGARGVLLLPYLEGERSPRWNPDLRGEIYGLTSSSSPDDVARAVLEAAAFGLRHIVDSVAAQGAHLDLLVVAGSPAKSRLWSQIKADVLGVPVGMSTIADLAAFGTALAAGAALGWWPAPGKGPSGSWPTVPRTVIEPHPDPLYDEAYAQWRALGDAAERRLTERMEAAQP